MAPLIVALADDQWEVRRSAAWALGEIGDGRAVLPLIAVLGDKRTDVREAAGSALDVITGEDIGPDFEEWVERWDQNKDRLDKKE